MKITSSSVLSLSGALLAHIFTTFKYVLGQKRGEKGGLTMYHIPRMMVPVRTWQHRQQLVEYHRSHGEIILGTVSIWKLVHECCRKITI